MAIMQRLHPHVAMPGLLTPQVQSVDFKKYLGATTNMGALGMEKAYFTSVTNINSETLVGQQWGSDMAKQSYTLGQLSASYYRIAAMVEYNVDEQAKFELLSNGVSLPSFLEDLARQGINQRRHQGVLLGFDNAETSQGIMGNATEATFAADSQNVSTLIGYDIAELQARLSGFARSVMDASYGMLKPVVIASSVRVINYLKTAIVPLVEGQKDGGGIDSVAGVFGKVSGTWLGVGQIEFIADDLLKEADTTDAKNLKDIILFIAPGMDTLSTPDNQNIVGENNITYNTWCDEAAGVMRFDAPPALGRYQSRYMVKMTPGVTLRSEGVIKTSIKYS